MATYKPIPKLSAKAQAKFWSLVDRLSPDGCWLWLGPKPVGGYGRFRERRAHRVAYVLTHGEPGSDLTLDHLCRNRACVNPSHLQPITNKENILRGTSFSAINAAKTHCKRGHPLTPENLYTARTRQCRLCRWIRRHGLAPSTEKVLDLKQRIEKARWPHSPGSLDVVYADDVIDWLDELTEEGDNDGVSTVQEPRPNVGSSEVRVPAQGREAEPVSKEVDPPAPTENAMITALLEQRWKPAQEALRRLLPTIPHGTDWHAHRYDTDDAMKSVLWRGEETLEYSCAKRET